VQLAVDLACVLLQLMSLIAEGGVESKNNGALSLSLSLTCAQGFQLQFHERKYFSNARSVGWLVGWMAHTMRLFLRVPLSRFVSSR
jgi:hypothetical protein